MMQHWACKLKQNLVTTKYPQQMHHWAKQTDRLDYTNTAISVNNFLIKWHCFFVSL